LNWKKALAALVLPLVLFVVPGCETGPQETVEAEDEFVAVETRPVEERTLEIRQRFSGEVNSEGNVTLSAAVGGEITGIHVSTGQKVREGQLLVELKNDELRTQVQRAQAALEQAEAGYVSSRDYGMPQREKELQSALQQAEIEHRSARDHYERMQRLYEGDAVSRVEMEQARDRYEQAESRYQNAGEQLELLIAGQEKELQALRAQLAQARAALDSARTALDETKIEAPFDGTVTLIEAKRGTKVQPGAVLLTMVDFEQLYVALEITEKNLAHMEQGQKVQLEVPAANFRGEGVLQDIAYSPRPGSRAYPVKVFFTADAPVRVGMQAQVSHFVERAEDVLAVPRRAILEEGDSYYCFVVEEGRARQRQVQLGLEVDDYVEIQEGLSSGEEIVVQGQHYLEEGTAVEVVAGGVRS